MISIRPASESKAVEMAAAGPYDLVLMDVQMPVMDGLAAAAAIRRLPGWGKTPILAMTANVFEEDRQRCLAAGMNAHVAKPVKPEALYSSLVAWLPEREGAGGELPPAPLEQSGQTFSLDAVAGLNAAAGLKRVMGDAAKYARLLGQFVESHGRDAAVLSDLLDARDLEAVRHTAHALKGVAGMLGAEAVQQSAQGLESGARAGESAEALWERLKALTVALSTLVSALKGVLAEPAVEVETVAVDAGQVAQLLGRLETLLDARDTGAEALSEAFRGLLRAALGEPAETIGRQIRDFDYEEAREALRAARNAGRG